MSKKTFTLLARLAAVLALAFIVYVRFFANSPDGEVDESQSPYAGEQAQAKPIEAMEVAANDKSTNIEALYAALGDPIDKDKVSEILATNAEIEIRDLEIKQTSAEYVESLSQWEEAIEGGKLDYKFTGEIENGYEMAVCYRFISGDFFGTKDSISFDENGKVVLWIQEAQEASCN